MSENVEENGEIILEFKEESSRPKKVAATNAKDEEVSKKAAKIAENQKRK